MSNLTPLNINITIQTSPPVFRLPPTSWGRPRSFGEMCLRFPRTLEALSVLRELGLWHLSHIIIDNAEYFDPR